MDATSPRFVVFMLADRRYALRLAAVERIFLAAEVTPLPRAPDAVLGVIDIHGRIVPVFDVRRRFRLPAREIQPSDKLIYARTSKRAVALAVESVAGVIEVDRDALTAAERIHPDLEYVAGALALDDGLVLIHDLDSFLSAAEDRQLEEAVSIGYAGTA